MATEIQNKFVKAGVEYKFATDETPTENSVKFLTSGAMYDYIVSLSGVAGKTVTTSITQYSIELPTAGAVYDLCSTKAEINTGSKHLASQLRHNVFEGIIDGTSMPSGGAGKTYYSSSAKSMYYFVNSSTKYKEDLQEGVVYYNRSNGRFCTWNASNKEFTLLTVTTQ